MKRLLTLLSVFISFTVSYSQGVVNNLVIFCNEGEPFTLILNGERYNETPQTRVRVEGLTLKQYNAKIIFKNEKLKDHETTITFFYSGNECEFALNKKGKRKHTLDYLTSKRIEGFDTPQNNSNTSSNNNSTDYSNNSGNNTTSNNSTQTTTLSSTPINTVYTGQSTIPGMNSNDPVNINSSDGSVNINMGNEQFQIFKSDIIKEVGDAAKEAKALALLRKNLFTSEQVKESMHLLSTEQAKVNYAKKAYPHIKDKENFYRVVNSITSVDLRNDLQKFVEGVK